MGRSVLILSKNGWECVFFLEKWVRIGRYCGNKGRSVSLFSKNGWECVFFLKNGLEFVVIVEIRVGVCRFCRKMGGSAFFFFFFLNGCEWKRVAGSGWERNSVKPVRKVLHLVN